jgi:hypothetical protein
MPVVLRRSAGYDSLVRFQIHYRRPRKLLFLRYLIDELILCHT